MLEQRHIDKILDLAKEQNISRVALKVFSGLIYLQLNIEGAKRLTIDESLTKIYQYGYEKCAQAEREFDEAIDELVNLDLLSRSPIQMRDSFPIVMSHTYSFAEDSEAQF